MLTTLATTALACALFTQAHQPARRTSAPIPLKVSVESLLQVLAPKIARATMADIEGSPKFSKELLQLPPSAAIDVIAGALRRTRLDDQGILVLKRASPKYSEGQYGTTANLLAFLLSLDDSKLRSAAAGNLRFAELNPYEQQRFLGLAPITPGLASQLSSAPESIQLDLTYVAAYEYRDDKGAIQSGFVAPGPRKRKEAPGKDLRVANRSSSNGPKAAAGAAGKGPHVSFSGQILSLKAIVERATRAFGGEYAIDSRLSESTYFMMGDFGEEEFNRLIEQVASAAGPSPTDARNEVVGSMLQEALSGHLRFLDDQYGDTAIKLGELLAKRRLSADDLSQRAPEVRESFLRKRVRPETSIQLRPALLLTIDAGPNASVAVLIRQRPKS